MKQAGTRKKTITLVVGSCGCIAVSVRNASDTDGTPAKTGSSTSAYLAGDGDFAAGYDQIFGKQTGAMARNYQNN